MLDIVTEEIKNLKDLNEFKRKIKRLGAGKLSLQALPNFFTQRQVC